MIRKFQNHTPQIPDSCYIFPTATIIGNVILGENVIAYPGVVIRAEHHQVTIEIIPIYRKTAPSILNGTRMFILEAASPLGTMRSSTLVPSAITYW